jgi:tricorn protease
VAFYNLEGQWEVENYGVAPDIEVDLDPKAWREGHDLQLERAIAVVMEGLRKNPLPKHRRPAYPNYQTGNGRDAGGGRPASSRTRQ